MGPVANLLETSSKRLASAPVVDVLDMHHLEARLEHDAARVEVRVGREAGGNGHTGASRMGVATALGIGVDI